MDCHFYQSLLENKHKEFLSSKGEGMKSYVPRTDEIQKKWFVIDASGHTLGRLASCIAKILTGKYKATYVPFMDVGDYVIVINAEKVILTGNKWEDKLYRWHTGYPGGLKEIAAKDLIKKDARKLLSYAVSGMLPKNKLRKRFEKKLKIYKGEAHPHVAQQPEMIKINFATKKLF